MPPPLTERRRHVRFDVHLAVEISGPGLSARCITEELGAGGCRITLPQPVPVGTLLRIRLSAYGAAGEVAGVAQVVWASTATPGRVGLAFAAGIVEVMEPLLRAAGGGGRPATETEATPGESCAPPGRPVVKR